MDNWNTIRKLAPMAPIGDGISSIERLMPRGSNTGLVFGYCDFEPGTINMEVGDPEVFIVVAGTLLAKAGDEDIELEAGTALWMPAGMSLQISAPEAARVVYVIREGN